MTPAPLSLRVLLLAALAAAGWLVLPFADALLVGAVAAVLAWPMNAWLLRRLKVPRAAVTALTVLVLTVVVVVPLGALLWLVSQQLTALGTQLAAELNGGDVDTLIAAVSRSPAVQWIVEQAGGQEAVAEAARTAAHEAVISVGRQLGLYVPGVLGGTVRWIVKVAIFYVALTTLFQRGESLVAWARRMSPLPDAHTARLFEVFAQFARNVVLAGIVTAMVQGAVAGIGYALAGVDRPVLFAVLTGVLAFVPLIGTAAAWAPLTLLLLLQGHTGEATFLLVWSVALTGTVDNVVKPLLVRGRSDMPTLLVFLGVFGGLLAFGVIGILVGPVLMALVLALLHLYEETISTPS